MKNIYTNSCLYCYSFFSKLIIFFLFFCSIAHSQILQENILFKKQGLYINNQYVSPEIFKNNIYKENYPISDIEKIDIALLDEFEFCMKKPNCNFNYYDSFMLIHNKFPEMNSEPFGSIMYNMVMRNLNKHYIYLDIKNKIILDGILGEIYIMHDTLDERNKHIKIYKNMLYKNDKLNKGQKLGVSYLIKELEKYNNIYVINSKDHYTNLRVRPNINGEIINQLKNGTHVIKINSEGDWYFIELYESKETGYVHKSQLKVLN